MRTSSLNIVLKDYNNNSLTRAQAVSQSRCVKAHKEGIELEAVSLFTGPNFNPENNATLILTKRIDDVAAKELREAVTIMTPLITMNLVDKTDPGTD